MIECDLEAFKDVCARFSLAELELGAAADDLATELNEILNDLEQVEHVRPVADDRQQRDAVAHLQFRVLVEIVQHHVGQFAAFEFDDDPHAVARRLVAQIGDAFELFLSHQCGDVRHHVRFVDLVGNLGDHDRCAITFFVLFERRPASDDHVAAAFTVRFEDAGATDHEAAGGEVWGLDVLQQRAKTILFRGVAQGDHGHHTVEHFAHVVRRDVGRHADSDTGRSVDKQCRERRRQHRGFFRRLVKVRPEVDGVFVEIHHHGFGERVQARFGVTVGGRRVTVDRAEIALAINQGIAHREVLRETNQRVVGRRIAVRVVVADDFADDLRALAVRAV